MIIKKKKEVGFISMQTHKILLPLNNFHKLFARILQQNKNKINKSRY